MSFYFLIHKRAVTDFSWWNQLESKMMRAKQWQVKHAPLLPGGLHLPLWILGYQWKADTWPVEDLYSF